MTRLCGTSRPVAVAAGNQAFSRRGVALESANVCTFGAHETYVRGLFGHLHRLAPPGYSAPTVDAVLAADVNLGFGV